jgi:hypothetical protein
LIMSIHFLKLFGIRGALHPFSYLHRDLRF